MSQNTSENIGRDVARRLVKMVIAVLGLIVIRLILDNLAVLKDAKPFFVGSGTAGPNADMARAAAQFFNTGHLPQTIQQYGAGFIFPVSIANAVVDTLIFAVLIGTAVGFNNLIRAKSKRLPEGGLLILLLTLSVVVALAYHSYLGVIPPLLGSQANIYGWFFLALGLLPLIGLIIVASRNLDAMTEVVFNTTKRAAALSTPKTAGNAITCGKCGSAITVGVKFCGACGTPVPAAAVPAERFCTECGTKNEAVAKFCNGCGKPLAV